MTFTYKGINKHFAMALVSDKLSSQFDSEQITSDEIWSKLRMMFDLSAVDDREEVIPFTLEEREFSLPRRDFSSLIVEKQKDILRVLTYRMFLKPTSSLCVLGQVKRQEQ